MTEPRDSDPTVPPTPPHPALPVVEYSTPALQNPTARTAMVWAALGVFPFIPGLVAIRLGRRGMREAEADPRIGGRGTARTAIMLGAASVVVWTIVLILAVPATLKARRQAMRVRCASNLRQMGQAAMIYATANRGVLPPNIDLLTTTGIPATVFTCPACAGDPTKPAASSGAFGAYSYVYVGNGRDLRRIRSSATVPLIYEPLTNHGDGGANVLFMDGHVELLQGAAAAAAIRAASGPAPATLPAALLPPPAAVEQ